MMMSAIILTAGISVAYYNTRSLAFEGTPVIASEDDEKYTFLDFYIYKDDIMSAKKKLVQLIPDKTINIVFNNKY